MYVEVSFPHTKAIYFDAVIMIGVYTDDTRQDIINRAISEMSIGQKIFNEIDGFKSEPRYIRAL